MTGPQVVNLNKQDMDTLFTWYLVSALRYLLRYLLRYWLRAQYVIPVLTPCTAVCRTITPTTVARMRSSSTPLPALSRTAATTW